MKTSFALLAIAAASTQAKISPQVLQDLESNGNVKVMVEFNNGNKQGLMNAKLGLQSLENRPERISHIHNSLVSEATRAQSGVQAILSEVSLNSEVTSSESFWISNTMAITTTSKAVLEKISQLPEVARIRAPIVARLSIPTDNAPNANLDATEWGVNIIQAPAAWSKGFNGTNVVVSNIDTGVNYKHEALVGNFRQDYGWYDPYKKSATPNDGHGHGTHTMGTIAGSKGIGVAPGATWIACKGCDTSECTEEALTGCAQFILCPTDVQGNNKKCEKAAHVVNNSWGGDKAGEYWYQASVDAWREAGIIPLFANGNDGSSCTTVRSPGDYKNVIGVGATNSRDALASFSSRGPGPNDLIKPDVSAPGENVRSAKHDGTNTYQTMSGTSMATPHVAGAVAVIISANPGITYDGIYQLLTTTVDTSSLKSDNANCGGVSDQKYPNNNYGFGRINVDKATNGNAPSPSPSTKSPAPGPTTKSPAPTPKPTTAPPPDNDCRCYFGDNCGADNVCHGCNTIYWGYGFCDAIDNAEDCGAQGSSSFWCE